MKPVSVMEGDSVTLHTDREMRNNDLIVWRFGPENTLIAEILVADSSVTVNDHYDERFRGRMKVDYQTGCLTIANIGIEHAGRYELQIDGLKKFFFVILNGVFSDQDERKLLSVMEGDSVNLYSDSEMEDGDDLIQWSFGNYLIVQINETADKITVYDDVLEGRFRDRLQVDPQTGSLNITNTRSEHTGFYQLQTNRVKKVFILSVYSPLPVPAIFCYCPSTPSSSVSRHVLLCSVLNVSQATLSWFKGNSLISSTAVPDFSISLSLPLEVEYQDKNTYSCVLNNSYTAKTKHLDISQVCRTCSDSDAVEAVIRLVVTALVGVAASAAIVVLVYDIRSRRAEQVREQMSSSVT
ncbi:natural killer cell receptor 2B4-like [Pimephales promelas]|nr:natural killer cell receptor 2B4-like [Pimephales promelas]